MTSKLCISIFVGLGFINSASAADICAKNGKDLALLKDSFPRFFQSQTEIHFARSQTPVAYLSVTVAPDKIAGEAKYKIPIFGIKQEKGYATQLCYNKDDGELKIELDNGKEFKVKVINDNPPDATVTIKGYEMTRKPAEYNKAMAILNGTSSGSSSSSSGSSDFNNNGGAQ
ncbi:MAG: hypothetical protein JSU04_13835 [Bdellovibrionales bacterium]|nr:hypothetical protein [Bdellovibrionales bacterium]